MKDGYSLTQLANAAQVTPRTVRYYVQQGLLPAPSRAGPQTRYDGDHLARLQLIRQLQRQHLPLAEIRKRLASLDGEGLRWLLRDASREQGASAIDYIGSILGDHRVGDVPAPAAAPDAAPAAAPGTASHAAPALRARIVAFEPAPAPAAPHAGPERPVSRSQWDRIVLHADIELHLRRPLSRHVNRQVDRLVALARQLLEEDQS